MKTMNTVIKTFVSKGSLMIFGALLGVIGFFAARVVNQMDAATQQTMVQMAQIQKDIKQIEVSIASINARMLTTEQVRVIAAEVSDAKISQAILEHVRKAHEAR